MSEIEKQPEDAVSEQNAAPAEQSAAPKGKKAVSKTRLIVELAALVLAVVVVCVVGEVRHLTWWCILRANLGSVEMQYRLGERYAESTDMADQEKAKKWLAKAAKKGHVPAAQKFLDVSFDVSEKIEVMLCVVKDDPRLQLQLAMLYRQKGDMKEAVKWYEKAAEQGLPEAQHALAGCYREGEGVAKDPAKAKALYEKAAKQGYGPSQSVLEEWK